MMIRSVYVAVCRRISYLYSDSYAGCVTRPSRPTPPLSSARCTGRALSRILSALRRLGKHHLSEPRGGADSGIRAPREASASADDIAAVNSAMAHSTPASQLKGETGCRHKPPSDRRCRAIFGSVFSSDRDTRHPTMTVLRPSLSSTASVLRPFFVEPTFSLRESLPVIKFAKETGACLLCAKTESHAAPNHPSSSPRHKAMARPPCTSGAASTPKRAKKSWAKGTTPKLALVSLCAYFAEPKCR